MTTRKKKRAATNRKFGPDEALADLMGSDAAAELVAAGLGMVAIVWNERGSPGVAVGGVPRIPRSELVRMLTRVRDIVSLSATALLCDCPRCAAHRASCAGCDDRAHDSQRVAPAILSSSLVH